MTSAPIIRSAHLIIPELLKSGPKDPDGAAGASAKRMMGASNVVASDPEGGSTMCVNCNRWHRPGSMCTKSMEFQIEKGRRVAVYHSPAPGNAFRDPGSGSYADAPQSGQAASEAALEGLKRVVTSHNYSQPESWAPQIEPKLEPDLEPNLQWAPPEQAAAPEPAPAPLPPPTAIRGIHNLLSYKPEPPKPTDGAKKLNDNSAHLQNQQAGYLTALRNWQSMYGAATATPVV
jgi:hypothetical protein